MGGRVDDQNDNGLLLRNGCGIRGRAQVEAELGYGMWHVTWGRGGVALQWLGWQCAT